VTGNAARLVRAPWCAYAGAGRGGTRWRGCSRPERQSRAPKRSRLSSWGSATQVIPSSPGRARCSRSALRGDRVQSDAVGAPDVAAVGLNPLTMSQTADWSPRRTPGSQRSIPTWRSARRGRTAPRSTRRGSAGASNRPDHGDRPGTSPRPRHRVRQQHRVDSDCEAGTEQELRSSTATSALPLVRNG
jgi:hypothetical protein